MKLELLTATEHYVNARVTVLAMDELVGEDLMAVISFIFRGHSTLHKLPGGRMIRFERQGCHRSSSLIPVFKFVGNKYLFFWSGLSEWSFHT